MLEVGSEYGPPSSDWGFQAIMPATIERQAGDKPVCVAELVFRCYR